MFEIIYKGLYVIYESVDLVYSAGMVATFFENGKVGICKPFNVPIGFYVRDSTEENMVGRATVAIGFGQYKTDGHEQGDQYSSQDLLYCSYNGKITNDPSYIGNPIIGVVSSSEIDGLCFITQFSNLESVYKNNRKVKEPETPVESTVTKGFNRYRALLDKN